jgi:hypothetical protein
MKYFLQYDREYPEVVVIHLSERMIRGGELVFGDDDDEDPEKKFRREALKPELLLGFCKTVTEIEGLHAEVSFVRYEIQLVRSRLFSWKTIIPHVLSALKLFISPNEKLEEVTSSGEAKRLRKTKKKVAQKKS